ncbi:hypothetical protein EVAR_24646_1 [Eumeta japonica]|uniref:Uncharacterized protein n=1 Tax=Eumeta variegata TaxID=151549 RepID=A0A4C1V2G0_EUMVA|nr:hypothetical protein EVAR_24646_1 [Eumeta japonica]
MRYMTGQTMKNLKLGPQCVEQVTVAACPNLEDIEELCKDISILNPLEKKIRLVFDTAACTNEKCLNDASLTGPDLRPLTEVNTEPTEAEGHMPNHFLIGRSCGAAAAAHFDDNVLLGPANWRTCHRLTDHFWHRCLREYLLTPVPRRVRGAGRERCPVDRQLIITSILVASRQDKEDLLSCSRQPHVKLEIEISRLFIIFVHIARNPFSETMKEKIRSAGLCGGGEIGVTTILRSSNFK